MCGLPSIMKSSSHKTWQTSLLFLKPLQTQNLKRKKWGDMTYYVLPSEKMRGTRPPCPPPNCAHVSSNQRPYIRVIWLMIVLQCLQIARVVIFLTSLSFYNCVTLNGNPPFTVHATAYAFTAAINLSSMLLPVPCHNKAAPYIVLVS